VEVSHGDATGLSTRIEGVASQDGQILAAQ